LARLRRAARDPQEAAVLGLGEANVRRMLGQYDRAEAAAVVSLEIAPHEAALRDTLFDIRATYIGSTAGGQAESGRRAAAAWLPGRADSWSHRVLAYD